jgi:hypothetical protein
LFANKFNEEEKGKKCEIGHMGKIQNWCKKKAHSQKQKRKKKEKKDRRRHIDVTSVAIVLRSTTVF